MKPSETSTLCVDTKQMSALATEDTCLVSTADIFPALAADIYPASTEDETAAGRRPAAVMSSVETG